MIDYFFLYRERKSFIIVFVLVLGIKMMHHLNNNKKNNDVVITAATLLTLATIMLVVVSSGATTPVAATTTTSNTTTTTTSSSGLELSPQPIWDEQATSTSVTPINETHSGATFIGNGTMTVPDTGETINMTNNGTAFVSPVAGYADTVSAYGREYVFSEDDDDDTTAITFYEIIRYDPTTFQGEGTVIAVFDNNATGMLAPFNGMMVVGTHEEDPSIQAATIILWEWQSGIPLPPLPPTAMEESPPSPMNITTTTDATAPDTNVTTATEEEQRQTTTTIPAPLLE